MDRAAPQTSRRGRGREDEGGDEDGDEGRQGGKMVGEDQNIKREGGRERGSGWLERKIEMKEI